LTTESVLEAPGGHEQDTVSHLRRQLDGSGGEGRRVRDEQERDPGGGRSGPRGGGHEPGVVDTPLAASAAARSTIAVEVAPGSWCPALRSPR